MKHQFRIFISYASKDIDLVTKLDGVLKNLRHKPIWSKSIGPGKPFTDEIKSMIATAHVFMPVITKNSRTRRWVNQEMGYAMALNIPFLPIAVKTPPAEMITQLQAIFINEDGSDIAEQVGSVSFEQLVIPRSPILRYTVEIANWPEKRAQLMADYANPVAKISDCGEVRQRGALSSFCIPNKSLDNSIWRYREGKHPRRTHYLDLIRDERMVLEEHARGSRCFLIIDPTVATDPKIGFYKLGKYVPWARLFTLLEFLKSVPDNGKVQVLITPRGRDGSLTIVGDWFVAESLTPRTGEGYKQTIFTSHPPTVLRWIREFDEEFKEICKQQNIKPKESLRIAIRKIEDMIRDLPWPKTPEDESGSLNTI